MVIVYYYFTKLAWCGTPISQPLSI